MFSKCGNWILSASRDNTLRLWNITESDKIPVVTDTKKTVGLRVSTVSNRWVFHCLNSEHFWNFLSLSKSSPSILMKSLIYSLPTTGRPRINIEIFIIYMEPCVEVGDVSLPHPRPEYSLAVCQCIRLYYYTYRVLVFNKARGFLCLHRGDTMWLLWTKSEQSTTDQKDDTSAAVFGSTTLCTPLVPFSKHCHVPMAS